MAIFTTLFQILLFLGALTTAAILIGGRVKRIRQNILLGRDWKPAVGDHSERLRNMLLMAVGQKKMFDKPFVGLMHFIIYAGFLLINLEVLEIVLDGLTGQHRILGQAMGALGLGTAYPFIIHFFELIALGVVLSCVVFLARRNAFQLPRFHKPEMKGWPELDANLILIFEIILMGFLYTMNATDAILQSRGVDHYFIESLGAMQFAVSQLFIPLYQNLDTTSLILLERLAWWLHILGILAFGVYVTYSKHLHIVLAFPTTYFKDFKPKGEMDSLDTVTKEVKIAMGLIEDDGASMENMEEPARFGAKDVPDLTWKNIMEAYACTECGRCTSQCPANQTGKKLSPRKIMMDVRDRAEEIGRNQALHGKDYDDGKSLFGDYTTREELMACTTCNACVEACPVNINPLDIILQQRRYIAMEEASVPDSWKSMLSNVQNSAAPWAFSPSDRFKWADEINND
ncbi:MAG: 4Fe-4S dicluster domain-containing protein [Bernardetiaceae bacterium]